MRRHLRNLFAGTLCVIALMASSVISAGAMQNPTTGQPGAPTNTCGPDNPVTPGNSASSPGSPFNPNVVKFYAGNANSGSLHANSSAAVSQYDVACVRLSP